MQLKADSADSFVLRCGNLYAANEYGFYPNVNPNRPHPRRSQKQEQRLGGGFLGQGTRMDTVSFSGYGD